MASLGDITFACEDPRSLAEFWAEALEYEIEEPPPELIEAIEAEGGDLNAAAASGRSSGRWSTVVLQEDAPIVTGTHPDPSRSQR